MGTPGTVTVRWKNRYWVVYHRYDAYPEGPSPQLSPFDSEYELFILSRFGR